MPRQLAVARSLPARPVSVLVASPQRLVRAGIRALLEDRADVRVVGEAASVPALLVTTRRVRPAAIVVDLDLPEIDDRVLTGLGDRPVLLLGDNPVGDAVLDLLRAGVRGFASKDSPGAELAQAITEIAAGHGSLPPMLVGSLLEWFSRQAAPGDEADAVGRLTPREREVLALVAEGRSNAEIAEALTLSRSTVKSHVYRLLKKLDAADRVSAVATAYRSGLMPVAPPAQPRD